MAVRDSESSHRNVGHQTRLGGHRQVRADADWCLLEAVALTIWGRYPNLRKTRTSRLSSNLSWGIWCGRVQRGNDEGKAILNGDHEPICPRRTSTTGRRSRKRRNCVSSRPGHEIINHQSSRTYFVDIPGARGKPLEATCHARP
jgi:hypothetical protein